jgi:serine/threonine-protein kinase
VDERSDLYSVGVCLYEMLTGTVPFKGDSAVTVALKHVNEVPVEPSELVPGMPYALNQIVLKAMAKDPADRYQSAAEFARDLRAAKEGGPVAAAAFDAGGERTRVMSAAGAAGTTSVLDQPMPPRRKKSKWPLVLVLLLLAIIVAVAVALWWTTSGNKTAVPGVVGQSKAAAVKALEKDGFKAGVQEEFSDRVAEGFVSRQSPAGGTKMREGATVDIWVSKGSQKAPPLQDFEGWTASAVDDWLTRNDLVGDPRTGKSNKVAEGQVYRQDPAPQTELNRGDTVTYWVSTGTPQATVPDLSNLTQAEAEAKLTDAGLKWTVSQETSTTVPAGSVIRQDPAADTKVDKGSSVNIVVSTGSPSPSPSPSTSPTAAGVAVPNVYGMQSTTAASELSAAGLTVAFRQKANTGAEPGTVVKIKPDAGTVVPQGSTVLLVIAS